MDLVGRVLAWATIAFMFIIIIMLGMVAVSHLYFELLRLWS